MAGTTTPEKVLGWTSEDFWTLPDDGARYEIIGGYLLREPPPAVRHQAVVSRLLVTIARQLSEDEQWGLFTSPIGVALAGDTVVQPDVLYVRPGRRDILQEMAIAGPPDFVAEVLSPAGRDRDLLAKRQACARLGVPEYLVVDPETRRLYAFSNPTGGDYRDVVELGPGGRAAAAGPWTVEVAALFAGN